MWGGKQLFAFLGGGAAGAVESVATTGEKHRWVIPFRCRPIRVGFTITTAITVTTAILRFDVINRTVAAVAQTTTEGACGTISMPVSTSGVGKCYYENTDYSDSGSPAWDAILEEGDIVIAYVSQAATAGEGIPFLVVEIDPEQPANNSSMVSG